MKMDWKNWARHSRKLGVAVAFSALFGFVAACDVEDDGEGDATATGDTNNGGGGSLVQACQEWVACCVAASPGRANAQANCEAGAMGDYQNDAALCTAAKVDFPGCQ